MTNFKRNCAKFWAEGKNEPIFGTEYDYETKKRLFLLVDVVNISWFRKRKWNIIRKKSANKHNISVKHVNDDDFERRK